MVELGITNIKNDRMSDLINCFAKKAQLNHPFSGPFILLDSVFQAPVVPFMPLITTHPTLNDKKIDSLTYIIRSLALLICTLQRNKSAFCITSQPKPQLANASSESCIQTDY